MRRFPGTPCARLGALLVVAGLAVAAGCQPVREDRTITWSSQGDAVGFQHGREGLFVADRDGGGLHKIFQPGDDVLAVSPPQWAPVGGRLIFTTARAAPQGVTVSSSPLGEPDPAGRVFVQQPVVYTCWLRAEARGGEDPEPVLLFDAECDHVGYVAANLAVRWHPQGDRVLYVKQVGNGRHGVFAFDLATRASTQVFPQTAEAVTFEWAPDGENLVCVLANGQRDPATDGIWIGRPDAGDWWHVPDSAALAEGRLPSLLEQLRATQPAWVPDGDRFAFVSCTAPPSKDHPVRHFLCLGSLARRDVSVAAAAGEPFRDLHWAPDGKRLGVVQGGETGSLRLLPEGGDLSGPVNRRPVRDFAGWQPGGTHLAYVVPDRVPGIDGRNWALLLVPDPVARDAVVVADGRGTGPAEEVLSGMRVTFPHWSPKGGKLSLWATFSPPYHSWFSQLLVNLGVRRGDPAAVFDTTTGQLGWMPTDAREKEQVGHYYLLKHDYAEAWRWYEQAEKERPANAAEPPPLDVTNLGAVLNPPDPSVFEYLCLVKLGRHREAEAKLARFRKTYLTFSDRQLGPLGDTKIDERTLKEWLAELVAPDRLTGALLRDLYLAEVFLSVDATADGEHYFRRALDAAPTDGARLSSALVLTQFLLLEKKQAAYADLATKTIAPLLFQALRNVAGNDRTEHPPPQMVEDWAAAAAGALVLVPLASPDFVAGVPADRLRALLPRWRALAADTNRSSRVAGRLVLHAAYQRLKMEKERREVEKLLHEEDGVDPSVDLGRQATEMLDKLRQVRFPVLR
jgi:tetratricopeptide (TPR) repeat protein